MKPLRTTPAYRFVYVIGPAVGLQKIGLTTDPRSRMATLQTAIPFDLVLHLALRVPFGDAHAIERRAHRALAHVCARNEWFTVTPAVAVAAVRAAAVVPKPVPVEWRPAAVLAGALPLFAYGRSN